MQNSAFESSGTYSELSKNEVLFSAWCDKYFILKEATHFIPGNPIEQYGDRCISYCVL